MENWTAESLMALVGAVLSLVFAYLPFAKDWYEKMDARYKPLFMVGILFVVSVAYVLLTCRFDWACARANASEAFTVFIAALFANMATYAHAVKQFKSPRPAAAVNYPEGFIARLYHDTEPTGSPARVDYSPRQQKADAPKEDSE